MLLIPLALSVFLVDKDFDEGDFDEGDLDTELDTERLSWTSQNSNGAYSSALKLPSSGYRNHVYGTLKNIGTNGLYWSSSWQGDPLTATHSEILNFSTFFTQKKQKKIGGSQRNTAVCPCA